MSQRWDAVVVGGGHNGLVAAALLAKEGMRRGARSGVGRRRAAVTEEPWGPEFKVTALSYVMSLMPDAIVNGLDLARHGYEVYPMGPSYLGLPDGRGLVMGEEPADRYSTVAAFSKRDAVALERWDAWMDGIAAVLGPLLTQVPPSSGPSDPRSPRPAQGGLAPARARRGEGRRRDPLFTMSVGDLLREWFESDAVQALMAVNGVIGTWAGPEEPGTAHVMLHHSIGDVGAGSSSGSGAIRGRHGRGGRCHPPVGGVVRRDGAHGAPVERVLTRTAVRRASLVDGEELSTDTVISAVHPQIGFLRHLDAAELPDDFVTAIRRWRSERHGEGEPRAVRAARLRAASWHAPPAAPHRRDRAGALTRVPRAGVPGGPQRSPGQPAVQRRLHPLDARPHAVPRGDPRDEPVHAVGAVVVERGAPSRSSRPTPTA